MTTDEARAATERICQFFETLAPQSLAQIGARYTPEARFKDPFNEVQGHAAIRRIFEHMFTSLHEPRFVVTQQDANSFRDYQSDRSRAALANFEFDLDDATTLGADVRRACASNFATAAEPMRMRTLSARLVSTTGTRAPSTTPAESAPAK